MLHVFKALHDDEEWNRAHTGARTSVMDMYKREVEPNTVVYETTHLCNEAGLTWSSAFCICSCLEGACLLGGCEGDVRRM